MPPATRSCARSRSGWTARRARSDSAARLGGDEFALLLEGFGDELEVLARRGAHHRGGRPPDPGRGPRAQHHAEPRASPSPATTATSAEDLLRDADAAMYLAKDRGKGRHAVFEPGMHAGRGGAAGAQGASCSARCATAASRSSTSRSSTWRTGDDRRRRGARALGARRRAAPSRRRSSSRSRRRPGSSSTSAGAAARGVPPGRAAPGRRARASRRWSMSVNLSARQLQSASLVGDVRAALEESGIPPSQPRAGADRERDDRRRRRSAIARLEALRALGVSLALDDFGRATPR